MSNFGSPIIGDHFAELGRTVQDFRPAQARAAGRDFRPRERSQAAGRSAEEPDFDAEESVEDRDREIDFRPAHVQRNETGSGLADLVGLAVLLVWLIFFR